MDTRLRELERRAATGDHIACYEYKLLKDKVTNAEYNIVNRLVNAYEDEGRKSRKRPKERNTWADTMLIGASVDRVIEEWIEILKEHSGIDKISYATSIGRYAIQVPYELEDKLHPTIEACLPGLRQYYENIEAPARFSFWKPEHDRMSVSWYTADSRGFLRLIGATDTNDHLQHGLETIGLAGILSNETLNGYSSFDRGCLGAWATSNYLAGEYGPVEDVPGSYDICPEFLKPLIPENWNPRESVKQWRKKTYNR